jgi:hypothetical protein
MRAARAPRRQEMRQSVSDFRRSSAKQNAAAEARAAMALMEAV